jgi:hypothetical protein
MNAAVQMAAAPNKIVTTIRRALTIPDVFHAPNPNSTAATAYAEA